MRSKYLICFFLISNLGFGQVQNLVLKLNRAPLDIQNDFIVVSEFYGSDFSIIHRQEIPNDSLVELKIQFGKASKTGLYQLYIEDPTEKENNKVELILNPSETPTIEANYYQLKNGSFSVLNSVENQAYNDLTALKEYYGPQLADLRKKRIQLSHFEPNFKQTCTNLELEMELLQAKYDQELISVNNIYPETFATRILLPLSLIPVRSANPQWAKEYDSYLSFLHKNYFHFVDFENAEILRHYVFCDNLFFFLNEYSVKNEIGAKKGIDVLMGNLKENQEVNSFVFNYLLSTFLKLENESLTMYLIENHSSNCSLDLPFEELKKLQTIQALSIGGTIPEISLPDSNKKYLSLRAVSAKNEYTILFFWISWCARCQKEIPELNRIYQKYKSSKIGVYTVSLDEKEADWKEKTATMDKNWNNVAELVPIKSSSIVKNFQISTTPAVFIVDKNGIIISKNVYGENLDKVINTLVQK
ncbi:MAG: TlpA disulfide reductase family protein [Bacteroidota bacterium]